jgi:RimJ/RimL family protein N-acetyltransferase
MPSPCGEDRGGAEIFNYLSGRRYLLVRGDQIAPTDATVRQLTFLCNEPEIYDALFRHRLGGTRFTIFHGHQLLTWSAEGWSTGRYQVFFLLDEAGEIVASVDVRPWEGEQRREGASREMGYWCSSFHSGLMTNAVKEVLMWVEDSGISEIHARVRRGNSRSHGVLLRNGFESAAHEIGMWQEYIKLLSGRRADIAA